MNECILLWAPLDRDYLSERVAEFPDVRMPIVGSIDARKQGFHHRGTETLRSKKRTIRRDT